MSDETPVNTTDKYFDIPFGNNGKITRRVPNRNYKPPTSATGTSVTTTPPPPPGASATADDTDADPTATISDAILRMEEEEKERKAQEQKAKAAGNTNFYRKPNLASIEQIDAKREEIRQKDLASMKDSSKIIGDREGYKDYDIGGRKMRKSKKSRKSRKSRKMRKGKKSRKMRKTRR